MTVPDKSTRSQSGLCWYAMQNLPRLLDAFTCEIAGVKEAEDIEYIHRMRVASRRLRAALPLFSTCFDDKQYRRWMQEITKITRALGEARDADVQIDFLKKSLKKNQRESGSPKKNRPDNHPSVEPAIRFLLLALQKRRSLLQKHVSSAILKLEKSHIIDEMQIVFTAMTGKFRNPRKRPHLNGVSPVAALRIRKRLSRLLQYERWVMHPEAVAEHHATRIAAKKLRYTMEVYGPVYRNNLKKPLARIKKIQEILGDLHDCDVWIDHITRILLHERALLRSGKGTERPDTITLASLGVLLLNRENERKRCYRQFVRFWLVLARANLWEDLRRSLDTGRKKQFCQHMSNGDDDAAALVSNLAMGYPELVPHSRHVTDLALMLFDALKPLHHLGEHERFLLWCAGQLHDIGWKFGQARHNRHGAEMVYTDEILPFDLTERGIIAGAICLHRGKLRLSTCPYIDLLSPENQQNALMIAAILRIADGLDYPKNGSVRGIRCTLSAGEVTCTVTGTEDLTLEKERALRRSDLFQQVFNRPLVIS